MSVHRECCNWCMWYGPVNQDGTIRKHRPATLDDKWGRPNQVQDMSADPCTGSNKPFAKFGCDTQTVETMQITEPATEQENATVTSCPTHSSVADNRGAHVQALPVPRCQDGATYGVWDELAGGFTFAVDCAMEATNWAAEQRDEDPDGEMYVKEVCRDHEEQPADNCEECFAEEDDNEEDDETDE